MAHEILAKLMMLSQMADASAAVMSKLMSGDLMAMLLLMTMSYLMLLTKLTRCTLMTDVQSYLTLIWMDPSLLNDVLIDDAARWLFHDDC